MAFVRGLGRTFLLVGFTMLLFVAYELVGTSAITSGHQKALAREFDQAQAIAGPSVAPTTAPVERIPPPGRRDPIGRLTIPRIGVRVMVVEGVSLSDLAYGPGHYPNTSLPWEVGTTGIAGHRTGWSQPFFDLDKLRRGDEITLQTLHGTFRYVVTGSTVVDPADSWVLAGNPRSRAATQLALTTCTPKYTSRDRLVVWADAVRSA